MLSYIEFKEKILSKLEELVSENDLYEIIEKTFHKTNRDMEAVVIMSKENKECVGFGQIHYFENLYLNYENGVSIDELVRTIMDSIEGNKPRKKNIDKFFGYEECKDRIVAQVISKERNGEIIEKNVNRSFLDLALVYRIVFKNDDSGLISALISNDIASEWGIDEKTLYKVALENINAKAPYKAVNIGEIIHGDIVEDEALPPMYVLASGNRSFGASAIAYPEEIKKAGSVLKGNFFILPSSQHDLILVPYDPSSVERYKDMVRSVNKDVVDIEDWLSDSVYFYDRESETVELAM